MKDSLSDRELRRLARLIADDLASSDCFSEQFERMLIPAIRQAVVLTALGNDAVVPLTEAMEALGISRDVSERLRKERRLRPIVTRSGRNTKLYSTVGHIRNLIRGLQAAPAPSRRGRVRRGETHPRPATRAERTPDQRSPG